MHTLSASAPSALPGMNNPLMDVLYAAACLVAGVLLSILLARLTKRFFVMLGKGKALDSGRFNTFASVISTIVRCVILFLAVIQALIFLGLQSFVTSLGATIGVGTIVITISMQNLLRDVAAGLFMLLEKELSVGDYVTIGGLDGRVEKFTLRTTTVRADTGELHWFTNGAVTAATSYSKGRFQISSDVSFSSACDPFRTMEIIEAGIGRAFPDSHATVRRILSVNGNAYTVRALCDCPAGQKAKTERDLMASIIRVMAEEGIALPSGAPPVVGEPD